jgi:hypothetical protein
MANNTPSVQSRNKSFVVAVIETAIIAALVIAGGAFYAGYQFKSYQDAKTKAAVQDALKAVQAPQVAEASPKN